MLTQCDQYTKLLMHFEDSTNANIITDSAKPSRIISKSGSPTISTAQKKFNKSSMYLAGTYISYDGISDFNFGINSFTVEWWEYRLSANGCYSDEALVWHTTGGNYGIRLS